jgi:hypothetical protein
MFGAESPTARSPARPDPDSRQGFALSFTRLKTPCSPLLIHFRCCCAFCGFGRRSGCSRQAGASAGDRAGRQVCREGRSDIRLPGQGAATEWSFEAPEAALVDSQGRPFARHYAGPTWEATDRSKIVGTALATEPSPKAGAIPWLLLSTKSSGSGYLPGCVLFNGTTPPVESGRPARVRQSERNSVSATRPSTSFTGDWIR